MRRTVKETIGTTILKIGAVFGMHSELLRLINLMQNSRMGVFVYEGEDGDLTVLRELVTKVEYRVHVPTRTPGKKGDLWYVRVLT